MRFALLVFAAAVVWWATTALPIFYFSIAAHEITDRIVADQRFRPRVLRGALDEMGRTPTRFAQASLIRAQSLVALRVSEEAFGSKSTEEADRQVTAAEQLVRKSLELNAADAFLWLMLYSIQITREGFDADKLLYLDESYKSGPYEGWIALRRNRLSLSVFPTMTAATQERVVSEFAALVDANFTDESMSNLTGVGWLQRERLLAALERTDIESRKALQKSLLAGGVKIRIPGVEYDERPWR